MEPKEYIITQITVVRKDGYRRCFQVKESTYDLEMRRQCLKKLHNAERIYLTYEQKIEEP